MLFTSATKSQHSHNYFAVQDEIKEGNAATVLMDTYSKELKEPALKEMKKQLLKGAVGPPLANLRWHYAAHYYDGQETGASAALRGNPFLYRTQAEIYVVATTEANHFQ